MLTPTIKHSQRVQRHVVQAVGGTRREAKLVLQACPHQVGHAHGVKVLRQAHIAVVVPDDAVSRHHQGLHERGGPVHQLHAQPHDEQHHRALIVRTVRAAVLDFDVDAVSPDFHHCVRTYGWAGRPV
jgi:hypothetical protein